MKRYCPQINICLENKNVEKTLKKKIKTKLFFFNTLQMQNVALKT